MRFRFTDEETWPSHTNHPNDPRNSGGTCPLCDGPVGRFEECLSDCTDPNEDARLSCAEETRVSDELARLAWVEKDLLRLRLECGIDRGEKFLAPALDELHGELNAIGPRVDTALERAHCRGQASYEIRDAEVLEAILAIGQSLEDRDTLTEHLKVLRHYGQHKEADALERTLIAAGFGPEEEEEEDCHASVG